MTLVRLRQKQREKTPVLWPGQGYGEVTRISRDGTWADMVWWQGSATIRVIEWRKRQPLDCLAQWTEA